MCFVLLVFTPLHCLCRRVMTTKRKYGYDSKGKKHTIITLRDRRQPLRACLRVVHLPNKLLINSILRHTSTIITISQLCSRAVAMAVIFRKTRRKTRRFSQKKLRNILIKIRVFAYCTVYLFIVILPKINKTYGID